MTPFGQYLEALRRSRNLQQTQLADLLGVHSCYVSAIENGKKGPPTKKVLDNLIISLRLDESEQVLLWDYVDQSQRTTRLPDHATADEYSMMRDLRQCLGSLSSEQITIIRNALKLGNKKRLKQGLDLRGI
ncbi:helix-turn-helix domain-containing protein [Pleionea sp. CnH1-48]|uniref:helix-turn-helix domain-containing protein n=1 Tax=Pleionea sp. CnH1-48 TaxID=2954494 RepID=UPI002096A058|nr:helix-turn-helix domain-containing protein [Pleionea sp. CnH1-48]MCO7226631.1 helix-turn-helix domain-containing protein [Pleionea sp. CnH1-48]